MSQSSKCQNCGIPDEIEFFPYVLNGIYLCQDCADLPVKKISKHDIN